jgi:F-type H+-transporting ATPase subunit delta
MADRLTIARPYAKAAFKQAQGEGQLDSWSGVLNAAATAVSDPRLKALIGSPRVTAKQLADFIAELAQVAPGVGSRRMLDALAENHRLAYLPEIAQQFDALKDEAEGVVDVHVTSAAALGVDEQQKLTAALERRFGRKVRVHAQVDPELIAGAIVRAGDLTIDGSYKSRLERLAFELTA